MIIYDPEDTTKCLKTFTFPRQESRAVPMSWLIILKSVESGEMDYVGFFVVTAGHGINELAKEWKDKGDYLRSHALQATALEVAEGFAERIHHMMRDIMGLSGSCRNDDEERFGARYIKAYDYRSVIRLAQIWMIKRSCLIY